ncbi:MAG: precorrin-3B C(17)-methyltransferase [Clostridiaceae bacterium]|nr:precorrin-3B C(17)-methyltransferase [Clostridiaceae bacterium]
MAKLYVIGIGPGGKEHMTLKALETIKKCDVIVGYTFYMELIKDLIIGKKIVKTGMKGEMERCRAAVEEVKKGFETCVISTGDSGLYGMAGLVLELAEGIEVEIIPGVTSSFCAAAEVGAPIMHDFCTISLSDLLTPWEIIEKRLHMAAKADFVIALYNPKSKGRTENINKAIGIILNYMKPTTPAALVKNAGREGNARRIVTLGTIDYDFIDMMTVVIIGNSNTYIKEGKMITPRGYNL